MLYNYRLHQIIIFLSKKKKKKFLKENNHININVQITINSICDNFLQSLLIIFFLIYVKYYIKININ